MFLFCIAISALMLRIAWIMPDLFRYQAFADMMAKRRPKAHTFL